MTARSMANSGTAQAREAARADLSKAVIEARAGDGGRGWTEVAGLAIGARQRFGRTRFWLSPLLQAARHVHGLEPEVREACEKILDEDRDNPIAVRGLLQYHLGNGTEGDVQDLALSVAESRGARRVDPDTESSTKQRFDLLIAAANVLQATDHSDRALQCVSTAQHLHADQPKLWFVSARILSERGDWDGLLQLWTTAPVDVSSQEPILSALVPAAFLIGEVEACEHLLRKELTKGRQGALFPLTGLLVGSGRIGEACSVLERARDADELAVLVAKAEAILGSAKAGEVEQIITTLEPVAPIEALRLRANLASRREEVELALQLWQELATTDSPQRRLWRSSLRALTQASEFEAASKLLEQHTSVVPTSMNRIDWAILHRAQMHWDRARSEVEPLLDDERVVLARRRRALTIAAQIAAGSQSDPHFLQQMTGRLVAEQRQSAGLESSLARLQIASGDHDAAQATIDEIPNSVETFDAYLLRSWSAVRAGDPRAAELFDRGLARTYSPAHHSKRPDLQLLSGDPTTVAEHDLVAFAVGRDELLRLPDFLRHHRALGVEKFVVVDNGSSDGSCDFLEEQPDVVLYRTSDSYVASGVGMRWVNSLLDELRPRRWVLFADIDELAVFEGSEERSLAEFCSSLDEQGFTAAGGYMLDMHGTRLSDGASYKRGEEMLATLPLFTNAYDFQPFELSPYENVRGGVRDVFLETRFLQMTKTPLIRADTGVRFLTSSHETTPAVVAQRSVVLLHFKFIGDVLTRHRKEASWTALSYWGNNLSKLEVAGTDLSLVGPQTVSYAGSDQLIELGLLKPIVASER